MNDTLEKINHFTGGLTGDYILGAIFFMLIGIAIVKLYRLVNRKKGKTFVTEFSFKYWLKDNWMGIALHILIGISLIRFTSQIVEAVGAYLPPVLDIGNDPMWVYLIFGLCGQAGIDKYQKDNRYKDATPRDINE